MEIADILHYLAVIRDIAGVIETDDPGLMGSLGNIVGATNSSISNITSTAPTPTAPAPVESPANVGNAVQAVMAAAPSVAGLIAKL